MSKWGLGHVSTLERRAMENGKEIDMQKIYEQEKNELFRNSDSTEISSLSSESDKYSSKKTKQKNSLEELDKKFDDLFAKIDKSISDDEKKQKMIEELKKIKKEVKKRRKDSFSKDLHQMNNDGINHSSHSKRG